MAKSKRSANAEAQARYRAKHLHIAETVDAARINQVVGISAKSSLERLARHYGVSQRAMLEKLLQEAERALSDGVDHAAWLHYCR